jgi:hypothetical protein
MAFDIKTNSLNLTLPGVTTLNINAPVVNVYVTTPEGESAETEAKAKQGIQVEIDRLKGLSEPTNG